MSSRIFVWLLTFFALIFGAAILTDNIRPLTDAIVTQPLIQAASTSAQTASAASAASSTAPEKTPAKTVATSTVTKKTAPVVAAEQTSQASATPSNQVVRLQNAYSTAPESSDQANADTRLALVNILCVPRGGSLSPISGSGVIIDPRGVILTNAHVAQYVLLSEDPRVNLSCVVRTGAPATARWTPTVLYIPPVWVKAHASDILNPKPTGTGEHDYALLLITGAANGSPLATAPSGGFSYLPYDSREAVAFQGDQVLVASYPAEFLGGITAEYNLYPVSSVTTLGQLITFGTRTIDMLSLGGIIEAQSGSSGGAVVNAWGRLVGLVTTTSAGATTADRDLRALTLSYISSDLSAQTSVDLPSLLNGDVASEARDFSANYVTPLVDLYISALSK
jgi:S1-C subfamily serine protease